MKFFRPVGRCRTGFGSLSVGIFLLAATAVVLSVDGGRLRRRKLVRKPEDVSGPPSACPHPAQLKWKLPPANSTASNEVTAVYGEVTPEVGKGHARFAALSTNLGTVGLLRDATGHFYASLEVPGVAADAELGGPTGAEVDVVHTKAPPAGHGELSFRGLQAVLELDEADVQASGQEGAPLPVAFLLQMRREDETEAQRAWKGWPRSFGHLVEAFVHLPSQGVWRLLAVVRGRAVTDGDSNFSGFLGDFTSEVTPLGNEAQCTSASAAADVKTPWYQISWGKKWTQFSAASVSGLAQGPAIRPCCIPLRAPATGAFVERRLSAAVLPGLLADFPVPDRDNSPAARSSGGLRSFGPKVTRLQSWGQYYNAKRVFSCETPDLAAVMADPLQYVPPPKNPPDWNAQGFCDPMLAEHFWWTPQKVVEQEVEWFYNEITVEKSAPYTYYMANGFFGGYMGIQEHAGGKKFAIFSVWDAGSKVEIVDWGEGVKVGRFGAEGTGANSHVEFDWKVGETVRFLVNTKVEKPEKPGGPKTTLYSGYIHHPELGIWRLLSRLRVQPCGQSIHTDGYLMGMNSFIEVFQPLPKKPMCDAYGVERTARYGTPWYRKAADTAWTPFANVTLTATCPATGCPTRGLGFRAEEFGHSGESFVLTIGSNISNAGLPIATPRPIVSAGTTPKVLLESPLPDADNSPAGKWRAGSQRPLKHFGEHDQVQEFGEGRDHALACPWYVADCD
eukprot:gnl/TRDRNA2_/TRDRNA2_161541_c0_seq1.p1 gnl/TRDRNA2_/TRDRNA2_161541_c0~~gnl/TRDRNA2_/TRDRNA2_161541_c0_seq1.p1  ORF type:complete len:731 (+),score=115.52 gnl/TRDRNA2_/TRDRNA2_161541_c0_seq1:28-2220(+)